MEKLKLLLQDMRTAQATLDAATKTRNDLPKEADDETRIKVDVAYWAAFRASSASDAAYHDACKVTTL